MKRRSFLAALFAVAVAPVKLFSKPAWAVWEVKHTVKLWDVRITGYTPAGEVIEKPVFRREWVIDAPTPDATWEMLSQQRAGVVVLPHYQLLPLSTRLVPHRGGWRLTAERIEMPLC